MSQVFISYSKRDKKFKLIKDKLIDFLETHKFKPWLSELNLPAGEDWNNSIVKALKESKWFIVVVSRESVRSEYLKAECNWALNNLKNRVIPLYVEECEADKLNLNLGSIQRINAINKDWNVVEKKLLNAFYKLESSPSQRDLSTTKPKIFQAPPLPEYYVDRPEYAQELKKRLLTNSSDPRTLVVTAIHGLGSIGKSTLAMALAHDKEVQEKYSDGILWATLGQKPNILPLLSDWVQVLGDYNFKATSVEAASNQLRTLLYDKAVLLVVDDAWNTEGSKKLKAFNVGRARCQVLVTSREAAIAKIFGAEIYTLDVMQPKQAMELVTKKLRRKLTDTETQDAEDLAKALGYLPLALELAVAQVAGGTSWKVLLQDMQQEVARLKTFDDPEARDFSNEASLKKLSLRASLNLSVQQLSDEARSNFIWLGVLPEDVNITPQMTATLWDMDDERDAADELSYLNSKSLLLSGVPLPDKTPTYRLHDLFHDLACNLLTAPPNPKRKGNLSGLGITLPQAHATFLEKYRNLTKNNLWHTLPDDGYIHQRLVWHLEKAQKIEEIHQLFAEESENGGNGWYEACDAIATKRYRLGQTGTFVTSLARAWELAEDDKQVEANLSQVISFQCRYALIIASLNSLAADLTVEFLIALLQKKVWTPEQALGNTLQSSNPKWKTYLLTRLANHLPTNLKQLALSEALNVAREIQDDYYRSLVLSSLAEELPSELLPKALAALREIQSDYYRAIALSSLAEKLPSELLSEALAAAREIQDEENRAFALSSLAEKLPSELLPEALAALREIQSDYYHAKALSSLAEKLPSELLPEALAAAREIQDEENRAFALISLAEKLPSELLSEPLAALWEIQSDYYHAKALSSLAEKLPSELLPDALAAAREIQDDYYRAFALSSLAEKLPELLPEALAAAREIQHDYHCAFALSSLAEKLPELLPEALAAAREIQHDYYRAFALSSLADKWSELLPEALAALREIQDDYYRAKALSSLAEKWPELLPEALAAAREIQDDYYRAKALSSLADKLPPELLPEALAALREIQFDSNRAFALSSLAEKLPSELLPEALAAAREIQSDYYHAFALSSLAEKLPELLPEALAAAREIQDDYYRAKALSSLADKLPELLPDALAALREIQSDYYRAKALSSLADKLPSELLPEALAALREIQSDYCRAKALSSLADKLPSELLPDALAALREIQSDYYRAKALSSLADKLPSELLPDALAAAREIQDDYYRAKTLSSLGDKLPELLPEALAAAREIQDDYYRAFALSSLGDKLPELLPDALAAAREIQGDYYRAFALSSLGDKLPELLPEALAAAREIQDDYYRAFALSSLGDKLPSELLPDALAAAREIQSDYYRAFALSSLGDKLPELLPEALAAARKIQHDENRAFALSSLGDKLPELLPEALAAARKIQHDENRAFALSSLADKLSQIRKTQLFDSWKETLHILSLHTRPSLLTDIKALTPVIFSLGGEQALKDTASAIQDVLRWWPQLHV